MKKITTILLAILFLLAFTGTALADDTLEIAPASTRYTYISSANAGLDIISSTAYMSADMSCIPSVDSCNMSIYLQRYENGYWNSVQHYTELSSTYVCYWSDTCSVTTGYTYRLKVYFYAKSDGITENTTKYAY